MKKVRFVSDLHLFAGRSQADRQFGAIRSAASEAEAMVLGGDIFDFRWAVGMTENEAVRAAVEWLNRLTGEAPECQFHYVLGNHDYRRPLIDRLPEVERATRNFSWHHFYFRLGDSLFLHGDVADGPIDPDSLTKARSRWTNHRPKGPAANRLYDLAVAARLHVATHRLFFRKKRVARRLLAYMKAIHQGPGQGVRNVYFGHTHMAMSNYRFGDVAFHNGGAPIKGLDFRIVEADVSISHT